MRRILRLARRRLADRRGAAALEFAMVIPVVTVFIFGVWYFGWALNCGSEVRHAVELGSRIYITNPDATVSDLQTAVASHLSDVPMSSVTLAVATNSVGAAPAEHITWSYKAVEPIPGLTALSFSFGGAVDVPLATP